MTSCSCGNFPSHFLRRPSMGRWRQLRCPYRSSRNAKKKGLEDINKSFSTQQNETQQSTQKRVKVRELSRYRRSAPSHFLRFSQMGKINFHSFLYSLSAAKLFLLYRFPSYRHHKRNVLSWKFILSQSQGSKLLKEDFLIKHRETWKSLNLIPLSSMSLVFFIKC